MAKYRPSLWDDSEPLYAPGMDKKPDGRRFWRCPKSLKTNGYTLDNVQLPADETVAARMCREMTREAIKWGDRNATSRETIKWVIARYTTDEFSEFHSIKANTAQDYRDSMKFWENAIGQMLVKDLNYVAVKKLEAGMKAKGRSTAFIHRKFTMLRTLMKHAKLIGAQGGAEARELLTEVKFSTPTARTVFPTRRQVYRIAIKAWRSGSKSFAVGIMMQFELTLRAVDVRGQWLPAKGQPGILVKNGLRWQDGLTWAMFDKEHWSFEKVISKTASSLPDPIRFDLTGLPRLREAILSLADPEKRIGPVFRSEHTGLPYTRSGWSQAWQRFRKAARVPEHIQMRDTRAGAITEAEDMGATREQQSQAAQHKNLETTARYARGREKRIAEVIDLRQRRVR